MTEEVGPKVGERWWTCGRCDKNYPQSKVLVQNGLIVCCECRDEPGAAAHRRYVTYGRERPDPPLPIVTEDL